MNKKRIASVIVNISIFICAAVCLYFLLIYVEPGIWRWAFMGAIVLVVLSVVLYEINCRKRAGKKVKTRRPSISTLILLGEDDRPIRVWDLTGKVGLLIGKSADEYQVDIDLSDTDYHTYIDPEHALLNYNESGWWLQDTSSRNGLSILRKGEELMPGYDAPARLQPGDVILIAKYTRIAVN